jgi:heptosyltransferase III
MAPAAPARALLGPGPSAVDEVLDWDDPAFLPLFAQGDPPPPGVAARFEAFAACIAYTNQIHLLASLERLNAKVVVHSPTPVGVHAAEWLARPARALGADPPGVPPDMEVTAFENAEAEAFLVGRLPSGFLAIHAGSGAAAKNWPSDRFEDLAREVGAQPFLLVEGPADATAVAGMGKAPVVRASHLPLRTLGAVLRRAGLFVGNDSGVTHLAAAWGSPTLALFGPTDPTTWAPVGRCVAVARSPSTSMKDLSLAEVSQAARAFRAPDAGHVGLSLK